ncbi:preprotein translocase subunit SecE [Candidatus Saccharibacteria bacterium]|nr:preprotein translocase subunit SecE [Candidatus Saccharibacteria bacterium]
MAKITRIKASDPGKKQPEKEVEREEVPTFSERDAKAAKKLAEKEKKSFEKAEKKKERLEDREAQGGSKVKRALTAPFRYIRNSWREIRQVRWPNRKATWKMVLAIFVYSALFIALIMLLDLFFTWIFNLILKK